MTKINPTLRFLILLNTIFLVNKQINIKEDDVKSTDYNRNIV